MVLKLDGTGLVTVASSPSIQIGSQISVLCKFKQDDSVLNGRLVGKGSPYEYRLRAGQTSGNTNDTAGWSIYSPTGSSRASTSTSLTVGQQYHMVGVYKDAVESILYLDGSSKSTCLANATCYVSSAVPVAGTASLLIGENFKGEITEVAIFSSELTSAEVADLSTGAKKPSDIASCTMWHDYRTGTANDQTANGNNGVVSGGATLTKETTSLGQITGSLTTIILIIIAIVVIYYFFLRK